MEVKKPSNQGIISLHFVKDNTSKMWITFYFIIIRHGTAIKKSAAVTWDTTLLTNHCNL